MRWRSSLFPEKRKLYALVGLVVTAGFVLRAADLGGDSLWHDEAFTWYFTRMPWLEMLDTVRLDGVNPPIYYIVTKLLVDTLGDGESILRGGSMLAGIAALWGAWLVGKEAGGKLGGLIGLTFVAFHPMAVHYSRDARPYGLVLALSSFLVYFAVKLKEEESKGMWWGAWSMLLLGQLSHYFFFVLGGVILLGALADIREKPLHFRKWSLVWLGAFLPLGGWLWWYLSQPAPSLGIGWVEMPDGGAVLGTVWNLFSGYGGAVSVGTMLFGSMGLLAASIGLVRKKGGRGAGREWLLWLGLPIAAVWMISLRRPVYVDRYFIAFLPAAGYLMAAGAASILEKWRREGWMWGVNGVMALYILAGLLAGWGVHSDWTYSREDWRGLVGYLNESRGVEEVIWLSEPEASIPIQYYLRGDLGDATSSLEPLRCLIPCWWVMRQPFTGTHAFSQSIGLEGRESFPEIPGSCRLLDRWESESGLRLWKIRCTEDGGE